MSVRIDQCDVRAPLPAGPFPVIYADPPWTYKVFSPAGEGRSASQHYRTMSLAEIKALPVRDIAAIDCHLFLWATWPNLIQAIEVMEAWGFQYSSSAFVWVKTNKRANLETLSAADFFTGMGHTTRKNSEFCLLGRRGNPKRKSKGVRELIIAPRREHSRKPDETAQRIEAYADGPYLELFARTRRPGWICWGNETDKFTESRAPSVAQDVAPSGAPTSLNSPGAPASGSFGG